MDNAPFLFKALMDQLGKGWESCTKATKGAWCKTAHTGSMQGSRKSKTKLFWLHFAKWDRQRRYSVRCTQPEPAEEVEKPHKRLISFFPSVAPTLYRLSCVSGPSLECNLHKTEHGNRLQTSLARDKLMHRHPWEKRGLLRSSNLGTPILFCTFFFSPSKKIWLDCRLEEVRRGFPSCPPSDSAASMYY